MYIRKPAVAGTFYPGSMESLSRLVNVYLESADPVPDNFDCGSIAGIVSPHAGYIYSGPVAACGYRYLQKSRFSKFIVLAPSHRGRFNGASVIPEGLYRTPLGDVEIDCRLGNVLAGKNLFSFIKEAHEMEHSLEVQIPFLQTVKSDVSIVPVVIGTTDPEICRRIGETIAGEVKSSGEEFGIIISTDLSHYHSYDTAVKKDQEFIRALESFDSGEIVKTIASGKGEACGEGSILAGIALGKGLGAVKINTVKYANSGDTAGSKDQVVGYLSAVITY